MAKSKNIQKAERESLNIKDKLLEALKTSTPEVFAEGKVNWDKIRLALGEHLDTSSEKFNFSWAGKAGAVTNVVIPSKATLRPAEKESVKFDKSENIFIEGDNLEVLKLLQKSYFEQVKMIYIDPPYNTGNDFVYKDDFRQPLKNYLEQSGQVDSEGNRLSTNTQASGRFHSDWLTMMYPRLKLAWNLLRHDGVIFVSIDDNEAHHLRALMDEVFGEENFIGSMVWKKRYQGAKEKHLVVIHEYIYFYAKDKESIAPIFIPSDEEYISQYYKYEDKLSKIRGPYRTQPLEAGKSMGDRDNLRFAITAPDGKKIYPKRQWIWAKERVDNAIKQGEIGFQKNKKGGWNIFIKQYLKDEDGNVRETKAFSLIDDVYTQDGTREMEDLFGSGNIFPFPKPSILIKKLLLLGTASSSQDTIIDFFAGSATTAHAVLAQNQEDGGNRKFIMVQMPEPTDSISEAYKAGFKTIADIAKERIRRVIKGYGDHKPIDSGFKVFKLGKSNYYDNLFEYDPEKSAEENDKAFKDYLNKTQKELFPAKINELDIIYENIIKEGLSLNAKIEEVKIGRPESRGLPSNRQSHKSTAYKVSDTEREIYISLDEKLSASAIEALKDKEYKEKIFICFDGALGDSDKANLSLNVTLKTI
ncbi:MAG: site-specific DNA-methyltransferase [Candidatus Omnitrophota bacterium]